MTTQRKSKEKPDKDNPAVEPSIITGAYLTCRETDAMAVGYLTFGCAVHSQNAEKLEAPAGYRFDFTAADSNKNLLAPNHEPPSSIFHVLFNVPKLNSYGLVFGANMALESEPLILSSPDRMTFQVSPPTAPLFNKVSAQLQRGEDLFPTNIEINHSVHWTYTNDLSDDPDPPTCGSARFGNYFGMISIDSNIKIKAITCSDKGIPSPVTELRFTVPSSKRSGSCGC